jgi:hypothetical protein
MCPSTPMQPGILGANTGFFPHLKSCASASSTTPAPAVFMKIRLWPPLPVRESPRVLLETIWLAADNV